MKDLKSRITELESENQILRYENSQLKRDLNHVLKLNKQIISENKKLRIELKKRDKKINKLEKKVTKLEKELEKHKVKPNQPSGAKPDYEKANSKDSAVKSGRKKGHKGVSRLTPTEIHREVEYESNYCEHCNSTNLVDYQKRSKVITDIEFRVINIRENYYDAKCLYCGKITKAKSTHGSSQSPFGKGIQTLAAYLSSVCGATKRPVENLFKDFFGLPISDTSLINSEIRNSKKLINDYNNYLELVKEAEYSHKDETSYRVGGVTNWIWTYDSKDYVFYRLADSRSKQVVIDDFGKDCKQISINDCFNAYDDFEFQQICLVHILREAKFHAEKDNASKEEKKFYKKFKSLYKKAKSFVEKDPPPKKRREMRVYCEDELCKMMNSLKNKTEFLIRICNRLSDRLTYCFLFVEIKDLPSTNNQAERSLRPFVCHRKVSQGSKSNDGGQAKVIFKTLFENAKRQKKQMFFALTSLFELSNSQIL